MPRANGSMQSRKILCLLFKRNVYFYSLLAGTHQWRTKLERAKFASREKNAGFQLCFFPVRCFVKLNRTEFHGISQISANLQCLHGTTRTSEKRTDRFIAAAAIPVPVMDPMLLDRSTELGVLLSCAGFAAADLERHAW